MLDYERADDIARFRTALESHGYARPEAALALGLEAGSEPKRIDLPLYLRRLDRDEPLHTLVRLFALRVPVEEEDARWALGAAGLDAAEALGVVERSGGLAFPRVGLVVTEGLVLAHDVPKGDGPQLRPDHVVGLNPPAMLLARLSVRRPVGTALDVGCGGGVQSLLAARHAEHVVGVDLNPRAIAFARFNARLNGVENVEFREGSLFEPVAGERFELVVCNPPYVISPETELLFRDGGQRGDAFCEQVVRGAAEHLAPGGFATAVVNWVIDPAEPWARPLERWVEGRGCDAWLLRLETSDPLAYAAAWNRDPDGARYSDALERWLAYYDAQGIRAIGMGAVVLRRRAAGTPWTLAVDLPARPRAQASEAVLRAFAAQDRIAELTETGAMLGARFRAADALRLTQVATLRDGRFAPGDTGLSLASALPFEARADKGALRLLQLADGSRTLAQIVAAITDGAEPASEPVAASLVEATTRLVTLGFLEPAEEAGGRGHAGVDEAKPAADAAAPRGVGGGRGAGVRGRSPGVGAR